VGQLEGDVDKEATTQGEKRAGRRGLRAGGVESEEIGANFVLTKKYFSSAMNNKAKRKHVHHGVLRQAAVTAFFHLEAREIVLMSHTTRGGKGIVDKSEVEKKKVRRRGPSGKGKALGDRGHRGDRRGEGRKVRGNEPANFSATVGRRDRKVDVGDQGLIEKRARALGKRDKSAVVRMAAPPEVVGRRVSVLSNKLAKHDIHEGDIVIVNSRRDESRAGGEEGQVERP